MTKRTNRLNSLLREVISEVIHRDVKNPHIHELTSVIEVDITRDLSLAKVYVSIIASPEEKEKTLAALNQAAGFIASTSSKKVVLRSFPTLTFKLDESAEKQDKIERIIRKTQEERERRHPPS